MQHEEGERRRREQEQQRLAGERQFAARESSSAAVTTCLEIARGSHPLPMHSSLDGLTPMLILQTGPAVSVRTADTYAAFDDDDVTHTRPAPARPSSITAPAGTGAAGTPPLRPAAVERTRPAGVDSGRYGAIDDGDEDVGAPYMPRQPAQQPQPARDSGGKKSSRRAKSGGGSGARGAAFSAVPDDDDNDGGGTADDPLARRTQSRAPSTKQSGASAGAGGHTRSGYDALDDPDFD